MIRYRYFFLFFCFAKLIFEIPDRVETNAFVVDRGESKLRREVMPQREYGLRVLEGVNYESLT